VANKNFCVGLHELEDGPRELTSPISPEWLDRILEGTDVQHGSDVPGHLEVVLTKNGSEVLVQGTMDVTVSVPCARTLDAAIYRLRPEVFLLLSPKGGVDPPRRSRTDRKRRDSRAKSSKKDSSWDADEELTGEEAARDTYSGEQVVLDEFLREFILLEIPMRPLREDLRDVPFEANPPLPGAQRTNSGNSSNGEGEHDSLDPRLSPLRALKARLENKE
jgi:uncharacterized metal-binding protein YceD (DUF177 family)